MKTENSFKNAPNMQMPSGYNNIFSFAVLLVLVLAQNPDWGGIGVLWWGSVAFLVVAYLFTHKTIFLDTHYTVWMLFFVGFCVFSLFWAIDTSLVFNTLKSLFVYVLLIFLMRSAIQNPQDLRKLLKLLLFSIVINIVWLLLTNQSMLEANVSTDTIDRLGTQGNWNANEVGMMSASAMLVALYFQKKAKRKHIRLLFLSIVILTIFAAFLSGSRKAFFMVLGGLVAFNFLSASGKRLRSLLAIIFLVILLCYLAMEIPYFYSVVGWRIDGFLASLTGVGEVDHSTQLRNEILADGMQAWYQSPVLGHGLDCYRLINNASARMYAHNNYVELLADLGFVGASIYYSAYAYCFIKLLKIKRKDTMTWLLFSMLCIQMVMEYGYVSYNTFSTSLMVMLMFAFISLKNQCSSDGFE